MTNLDNEETQLVIFEGLIMVTCPVFLVPQIAYFADDEHQYFLIENNAVRVNANGQLEEVKASIEWRSIDSADKRHMVVPFPEIAAPIWLLHLVGTPVINQINQPQPE
jgi:hypothetical protein